MFIFSVLPWSLRLAVVVGLALLLGGCGSSRLVLAEQSELTQLHEELQRQQLQLAELALAQDETHFSLLDAAEEMRRQLAEIAADQKGMLTRQQEWEEFVRDNHLLRSAQEEQKAALQVELPAFARTADDKQLVGAVEKVFLAPPGSMFSARIDTGATTSSLDAHDIERFERDGESWVRFVLVDPEDDRRITMERKVVRHARIIQAVAEDPERRPVVKLGVTVGHNTQTAEFTLSDRRHLEHPVLIGRNILRDIMVVDVSQRNIAPPRPPEEFVHPLPEE